MSLGFHLVHVVADAKENKKHPRVLLHKLSKHVQGEQLVFLRTEAADLPNHSDIVACFDFLPQTRASFFVKRKPVEFNRVPNDLDFALINSLVTE